MKIIEAMKQIKALNLKVSDLRQKIQEHAADLSHETPKYSDQRAQVDAWTQAAEACVMEISNLKTRIQKTNLAITVPITLGGETITKTIAEWVHRRHGLTELHESIWRSQGDRNLKEGVLTQSNGEKIDVKIRRHYSPELRDKKLAVLREEPFVIDSTLEVVNATTDLLN